MAVVEIDPAVIYFTFSRIRPTFSCGRTIEQTLADLRSNVLKPHQLPQITLLSDGVHYYSQNNRRLYCFKQLREEGSITKITARVKMIPNTKRMDNKYTPSACSLTATLKREGKLGGEKGEDGKEDGDESGSEDLEPIADGPEKPKAVTFNTFQPVQEAPPAVTGSDKKPTTSALKKSTVTTDTKEDAEDVAPAAQSKGRRKLAKNKKRQQLQQPSVTGSDEKGKAKTGSESKKGAQTLLAQQNKENESDDSEDEGAGAPKGTIRTNAFAVLRRL
jgi:hypothetical protein